MMADNQSIKGYLSSNKHVLINKIDSPEPMAQEELLASPLPPITTPQPPTNSLFVANLPTSSSNHSLAYALATAFRPFGPLRLIRASRDAHNRPYGFVDFAQETSATAALHHHTQQSPIRVEGRPVRVEMARYMARLAMSWVDAEATVNVWRDARVQHRAHPTGMGIILVFMERPEAERVLNDLSKIVAAERLEWLPPSTTMGNVVRSSGLVQLSFDQDVSKETTACGPSGSSQQQPQRIFTFEEEIVDPNENIISEIYIGRLCGWRVTRELLMERFGQYGSIHYLRLFNRGVVRKEAPVDAFAHIGYSSISTRNVLVDEDGQCWLGQVITVQPLIKSKADMLRSFAVNLSAF